MKTPRHAGLALRLTVTIGLLVVLLVFVADPRELVARMLTLSPAALALAVVLAAADRFLMAYKWRLLLRARGLRCDLWTAVRSYFASSLVGLVLPVTVGADAIRVLTLRHVGILEVTASIVIERLLGAIAMVSVALASCLLLAATVAGVPVEELSAWLVVVLVGITVFFVGSLLAAARWTSKGTVSTSTLRKATEAYGRYREHPAVLASFYVLSVVESLIAAIITYVVALGIGLEIPVYVLIATVPIALASARLPVSLGGFGVQEASFVYLGGLVGIAATDALSVMLLLEFAMLIALLPSAFDTSMLSLRHQTPESGVV
jgi:uncharacterized protein (TIRG00374 family)